MFSSAAFFAECNGVDADDDAVPFLLSALDVVCGCLVVGADLDMALLSLACCLLLALCVAEAAVAALVDGVEDLVLVESGVVAVC